VSYKNHYELAVIGLRGTTFWDGLGHRATFWELSASHPGRSTKYSVEAVRDAAIDKAKPIADLKFLVRQLEVHNRLHELYASGKLPKCMLSLYVGITEQKRTQRLKKLKDEMESQGEA
jgi:hypothetical protein